MVNAHEILDRLLRQLQAETAGMGWIFRSERDRLLGHGPGKERWFCEVVPDVKSLPRDWAYRLIVGVSDPPADKDTYCWLLESGTKTLYAFKWGADDPGYGVCGGELVTSDGAPPFNAAVTVSDLFTDAV